MLTSYLVSNAIILPMGAWFSMLIGRKRFYMICVALFTVSSFLCGMAPTLGLLIVFRSCRAWAAERCNPFRRPSWWRVFRATSRAWRWRSTAWAWWWRR